MNLLELIVRDKIDCPSWAKFAVQDNGGALKWSMSSDIPILHKSSGVWDRMGGGSDPEYGIIEMADDWSTRIITRQEWQQERDKMHKQAERQAPDNSWRERGEFPPFNTVIEWDEWGHGNWVEAKILADVGDGEFVMLIKGVKTIVGMPANFRPLRTEREKAIDRMISVISSMSILSVENIAEKLYDVGYRKEQTK